VCDSDGGRAEACARAYGVPAVYHSVEALVSGETADVVLVCTPDHTHAAIGLAALAVPSLRALVMEKPVASTGEEAEAFIAAAAQKNVTLAVNYSRRYAAGIQHLREALRAEKIRSISGYYTKGVRHNGTHWFDLAEFLGGPISRVSAGDSMGEGGDDPTLDVQLQCSSGATGFLKGCAEGEYSLFEMDICTDRGRYALTDFARTLQTWRAAASPTRAGYRELIPAGTSSTTLGDALPRLWQDLADSLDQSRPPLSNGHTALRALRVAEIVIHAANGGGMCAVT
jgi:predicted dehydrogenase